MGLGRRPLTILRGEEDPELVVGAPLVAFDIVPGNLLAHRQAEVQALQERLKHAVEITPDQQHEFATVAQAEGVSLSVARRLFRVVGGPKSTRSVATLGRVTRDAGTRAGPLLEVLDEAVRPKVKQGTADEIFLAPNPS